MTRDHRILHVMTPSFPTRLSSDFHKQQIDPILMSERFPYYDLDGHLAAGGAEIHQIIAGREDAVARAYWDAFNELPSVDRKVEGELYDSYVRGSARQDRKSTRLNSSH